MVKNNLCVKCGLKPRTAGEYCGTCKHKKLGNKCIECGVEVVDSAKYCARHGYKLRPPGTGRKAHDTKIKNGLYAPIGIEHIGKDGYVQVKVTDGCSHRTYNGSGLYGNYAPKHRIVMEQELGRKLDTSESVHHLDGNRSNNDVSNLMVISAADHNKYNHFIALLSKLPIEESRRLIESIRCRFPELF